MQVFPNFEIVANADTVNALLSILIGAHRILFIGRKSYLRPDKRTVGSQITVLHYHVISSILELTLFYTGFHCSLMAIAACSIQVGTSMLLTKRVFSGYPKYTSESKT